MESLQTGFIAQEIENILPELADENSEGYKSVNYVGVIPHLVEAYKTMKTDSEAKVTELESRLDKMENMLNEIQALIKKQL